MEKEQITISTLIGDNFDDEFLKFNLTDIQNTLKYLASAQAIDIAHAEMFQQQSLYGADLISEYLGKLVKMVSYLEAKVNSVKNKAALDYAKEGKITADIRKYVAESAPECEAWQEKLAKAKGAKVLLEKKHDTLLKSFYYCKEIAAGLRQGIVRVPITSGDNPNASDEWK